MVYKELLWGRGTLYTLEKSLGTFNHMQNCFLEGDGHLEFS